MGTRKLFAEQRQAHILNRLATDGRVDVQQLADALDVTHESVRKDLLFLESQGLLRRVHGGAIPVQHLSFEPDVANRTEQTNEKNRIARLALTLLPDEGSILIDAGSTTAAFAQMLPVDRAFTVYTNAISVAATLAGRPNVAVFTLGGRLRRPTMAEVGPIAMRTLRRINVDVAFLGTNSFSMTRGLTTPDEDEADVKREMLLTSRQHVFLVDHTKFGRESVHQHASLTDIDILVTDSNTSTDFTKALDEMGTQIHIA